MKLKKILALALTAAMTLSLAGCGGDSGNADDAGKTENAGPAESSDESDEEGGETAEDVDISSLAGTTISVYTHGGNRVLGEEKKDENGNTYRDESYAYLKHVAERFTEETGINVELNVVTDESEIEPLFKVEDSRQTGLWSNGRHTRNLTARLKKRLRCTEIMHMPCLRMTLTFIIS